MSKTALLEEATDLIEQKGVKKKRKIVNLALDVPVIKNRKELEFYLKKCFIIADYMVDKASYKVFIMKLRNLINGCFHIRQCREYPVTFKFYKEDRKTYTLELRHFYVNVMLWYPFTELYEFGVLNGSLIFDCMNDTVKIKDYIDNCLIQILRDYHLKNTVINPMISEVLFNLRMISEDFSLLLGLNIRTSTIMDVYEDNETVRNLMESEFFITETPTEIEGRLNDAEETIQVEFKQYPNNTIGVMLRAKTGIKTKQLRELIVAAGLKPTISGETISVPISNSLMIGGLDKASYFYIAALGARKSLVMNKLVMGKAGYYCKIVGMLTDTLKGSKTVVDCGTTHLVTYFVANKKILRKLNGKFYKVHDYEDLKVINAEKDKHLIGQKIKVRSAATCACGPNEICARCIGLTVNLNNDILDGYSIYETEEVTKVINQNILSTKHLLSTKTIAIEFNEDFDKFFTIVAGEINPIVRDNLHVDDIDDYAIYIDPKDMVKTNEQDYDSLFNTCIYNGKFMVVNLKNPEEKIPIHTLEEKELFITETALELMRKRKGYIYFKDLDDDVKLFEMVYINNELTKPLYDFINLTNKENKDVITMSIDDISQKLLELLIDSNINAGVVSIEIILNRLIRKEDDIYERPDFSDPDYLEPYQIVTVRKALMKNKAPLIGISYENIKRQFLSRDLYEKRHEPSYIDPMFKKEVSMKNVKKYFGVAMKEKENRRVEREIERHNERRMQKINFQ